MPPVNTQLRVRRISASTSMIDLQGKVTAHAEYALLDAYTQASSPTTHIVILNFSRLEYMNSAGVGLIVTLLSRVTSQKQRLLAFGLSEHYRHLFNQKVDACYADIRAIQQEARTKGFSGRTPHGRRSPCQGWQAAGKSYCWCRH